MGGLSNNAKSGIARLNKRPDLPEWWRPMQILIVALVILYLAIELISGKLITKVSAKGSSGYVSITSANQSLAGDLATPATTPASRTQTSVVTTPKAISSNVDGVPVALESDPSRSAAVPALALAMANIAAKATFTGSQSGLLLALGSTFTPPTTPISTVKILQIHLLSQITDQITFAVSVDLSDGVGARTFALSVLKQKGLWVFAPNG